MTALWNSGRPGDGRAAVHHVAHAGDRLAEAQRHGLLLLQVVVHNYGIEQECHFAATQLSQVITSSHPRHSFGTLTGIPFGSVTPFPSNRLSHQLVDSTAVWDFSTTRALLDAVRHRPTLRRLCGWETLGEVPSESTFSRAFADFAQDELPQRIHEAIVKRHCGEKLAGHVNRDATAIDGREKAVGRKPKLPKAAKRRGRRPKDEPAPPPNPTRLQQQLARDLPANLADLPTACDWGCKRNSQGKVECWRGYKVNADVIDGDVPVSFILSSASMHDSQAAIPLAQMTAERVVSLYDLADAAYDAKEIRETSERLGHVAIIDRSPRRGEKVGFAPAEALRYRERSAAERFNSHLKDEHGGRHVRVRGAVKVAAHLAFGVVVIAAEQLLKLLG